MNSKRGSKRGKVSDDEIRSIAKQILAEARKRARYEMECLTQAVLHEARVVARYAKDRPFYIS
jgi:ElaB/YqjD/DUF883 family membrane-anchored ribosome-binding protein